MRSFLLTLFSSSALCILLTACKPPTPEQSTIAVLYGIMTPHYTEWRDTSAAFSIASNNFCNEKSNLEELRSAWQKTLLAWAAVQAFPIGPVNDKNYASQVVYWPDPKNLVAFQVESRLKNNQRTALASSSVALRGLSAAEYILFNQEHDLTRKEILQYYCPLLLEISSYQSAFSSDIEKEWALFFSQTRKFPNARFSSEQEVMTEFLRVQVTALDNISKRLHEPLKSGRVQVYQLEHWRSGQSQASLRTSIKTSETIWKNGWRSLAAEKDADLATSIDQTYAALLENISQSSAEPMTASITTAEGLAWVRNRQSELHMLDIFYGRELARIFGIQIGFNANDGD